MRPQPKPPIKTLILVALHYTQIRHICNPVPFPIPCRAHAVQALCKPIGVPVAPEPRSRPPPPHRRRAFAQSTSSAISADIALRPNAPRPNHFEVLTHTAPQTYLSSLPRLREDGMALAKDGDLGAELGMREMSDCDCL